MVITTPNYQIEIIDEPTYTPGSMDNSRSYSKEYFLPDPVYANAKCGIILKDQEGMLESSAFIAATWYDKIHDHSALVWKDTLYLSIGNQICALSLPDLELTWHQEVDPGSCFGVYFSINHQCLISHGEQEIACLSLDGNILWSVSGKDIFSEGFNLYTNHIEATDFNHERYQIEISNGMIRLI